MYRRNGDRYEKVSADEMLLAFEIRVKEHNRTMDTQDRIVRDWDVFMLAYRDTMNSTEMERAAIVNGAIYERQDNSWTRYKLTFPQGGQR